MNRIRSLLTICLISVFFLSIASCEDDTGKISKPNVILIFADDMGYADLSSFGNPLIRTPAIDGMAGEGIRLTSFYVTASVCTPSRAALLTGRYPVRNLPNNIGPETTGGLPLSELTIADILKEQGYTSMAIGKWHLGYRPVEYLPTSRGFDYFYGLPYSNDMILPWCPWLSQNDKLFLYEDTTRIEEIGFNQDDLTVRYTRKALDFIDENRNNPFFLYLAHSMPHLPVSTTDDFRGRSEAGLYGDVIETIDWSTGQILNRIKELGLEENTMVVFTSDNGPWHNLPDRMLQRGVERWHAGSTGPFRGAKATTYEGGFRVPAVIRWPASIPGGSTSSQVLTSMDLFATIAGVCGASLPDDRPYDGSNSIDVLKGEGKSKSEVFFYHSGKNLQAVRRGEWKLRVTKGDGVELYNLLLDQSEKYNRSAEFPELVEELYREMQEFSNETGAVIIEIQ